MGVCDYKGGATHYHSIGQNVMVTSRSYPMRNGFFGVRSSSKGNMTRNIYSPDNLGTARDFYRKIANGGIEEIHQDGNRRITHMHDGTDITFRTTSHSDGTPVVEINIIRSTSSGGVRRQKIHFMKGEERK